MTTKAKNLGGHPDAIDLRILEMASEQALGSKGHELGGIYRIMDEVATREDVKTSLDVLEENKLLTHDFNPKTGRREISGRDYREIKDRLLHSLANGGQPVIEIVEGNFRNRGELVLAHRHDSDDIDLSQAKETLKHLFRIWTRPVHVETIVEDRPRRLSYDGESHELIDL